MDFSPLTERYSLTASVLNSEMYRLLRFGMDTPFRAPIVPDVRVSVKPGNPRLIQIGREDERSVRMSNSMVNSPRSSSR